MIPQLVQAEYVGDYRIRLRFDDGTMGVIDLANELWGPVFEPLRDVNRFQRFQLNRELNTICWDTGADLAPEFLYEAASHGSRPAMSDP